jgi:hypothetical protein
MRLAESPHDKTASYSTAKVKLTTINGEGGGKEEQVLVLNSGSGTGSRLCFKICGKRE